ncbi:hypothetical protein [Bacillus sp. FJAT-45037]|uniref:hypothetical protein n=1 Tax=Bacillus sp. FJAT-45037 TaxID=2011007 RepID=UPI000C237E1E|nr:hypothetical protein [Bacillus sp. FJAT-45037]
MDLIKKVLLFIFLVFIVLSVFFIIFTEFNPVGYHFHLHEDQSIMTIEEGFVQKDRYQLELISNQALQVMLPIIEAQQLWNVNLAIFSLLVTAFGCVYKRYIENRKHAKWFVCGFILAMTFFTAGHIHAHLQLYETITEVVYSIRQ